MDLDGLKHVGLGGFGVERPGFSHSCFSCIWFVGGVPAPGPDFIYVRIRGIRVWDAKGFSS